MRLPPAVAAATVRILGFPIADVAEPLEGRANVVAVTGRDGTEVVVKWSGNRQVLFAEWAALGFVGDLGLDPPVAPGLLGGDAEAATIVMERLAPGPSLAELLLGAYGQRARRGLVAVARALGRLHAASIGRTPAFEVRRAALGPAQSIRYHVVRGLPKLVARVDRTIGHLGVGVPAGLDQDLAAVCAAIVRPGPFVALVHGDPCPDNTRVYGDTAVLLDFQVSGVDHCLLDGSVFALPFPTCWCLADLASEDRALGMQAYRDELARALPRVGEDTVWLPALAHAAAFWFLVSLGWKPAATEPDELWGTATVAQRLVQHATCFAGLAEAAHVLPVLAGVAEQVCHAVRERLPDLAPTPAHPALAVEGEPAVIRPSWWMPAP